MGDSHTFGKVAEQKAAEYLEKRGFIILERNLYYRKAEIDILAKKDGLLVVVEVKARSSDYFGAPESFVSKKKYSYWLWLLMRIFKKKIWI